MRQSVHSSWLFFVRAIRMQLAAFSAADAIPAQLRRQPAAYQPHLKFLLLAQNSIRFLDTRTKNDLQYGHRYYASTIFRDLQKVFHDIISGQLWKVSSVMNSNCTNPFEFLIKTVSLRT